jgi:hypothetical protein
VGGRHAQPEQFEISVVPGEFFEQPQHIHIGFCGAPGAARGRTGASERSA